jgi:hypothetical protein
MNNLDKTLNNNINNQIGAGQGNLNKAGSVYSNEKDLASLISNPNQNNNIISNTK